MTLADLRSRAALRPPVVLAYHGVGDVTDAQDPGTLVVSRAHLDAHLDLLRRQRYRFATAEDVIGDVRPAPGVAVLTFDDGWRSGLTVVAPRLAELGVRATFYVCPGWWGRQHPDVAGDAGALLTREEAAALRDTGMELGSHTMTHRDLRLLDDADLDHELRASKAAIEDLTGRPCRTLAYPYGLADDRVRRAAEAAGYELAFDWLPGPWRRFAAPRLAAPCRHGARRLALKMHGVRAWWRR